MAESAQVIRVRAHELRVVDGVWPYASEQALQIAAHWQQRLAENPGFFNGPIHLLRDWQITDGKFSGQLLRTDFASFLHWRENGCPDRSVRDCFGSALLWSSDRKLILGRQSPGNINSGLTYFPGGFIDHRDVGADATVDMAASVAREISEELGFPPRTFIPAPGAYLTFEGQVLSIGIEHHAERDASALIASARSFIAAETNSELEDAVAVASLSDFESLAMPAFTRVLLQNLLG